MFIIFFEGKHIQFNINKSILFNINKSICAVIVLIISIISRTSRWLVVERESWWEMDERVAVSSKFIVLLHLSYDL